MDFSNRLNRPAQQPTTQQSEQPQAQMPTPQKHEPKREKGKFMNFSRMSELFILLCGALIAASLVLMLVFVGAEKVGNRESTLIDTDKYQAVFLDSQDGQVYFGKLGIYNDDLYILTDIYYVRVETPIQPQGTEQTKNSISLAKLGNELHGPEDIMYVARNKVLYWENLKDTGEVVKAITKYKADGSTTNATDTTEETQNP